MEQGLWQKSRWPFVTLVWSKKWGFGLFYCFGKHILFLDAKHSFKAKVHTIRPSGLVGHSYLCANSGPFPGQCSNPYIWMLDNDMKNKNKKQRHNNWNSVINFFSRYYCYIDHFLLTLKSWAIIRLGAGLTYLLLSFVGYSFSLAIINVVVR